MCEQMIICKWDQKEIVIGSVKENGTTMGEEEVGRAEARGGVTSQSEQEDSGPPGQRHRRSAPSRGCVCLETDQGQELRDGARDDRSRWGVQVLEALGT